jgi:4-hydroxy-tetrahydrodipicolinate synthase
MPRLRKARVKGLFTALITPFDSRGKVDPEALSTLVKFQIANGTEGIFPCGSTGLGPMLSKDERRLVADTVVRSAKGRVPVVVQVGAADTVTTVELAKHAEEVGADAVASLTPYYYKPGEGAAVKHLEAVSAAVQVPVFAYNIPPFTGNSLSPHTVSDLAKRGVISGMKDSSRDFLQLLDLLDSVSDDFVVMNGTEEYALYAIMAGADGLVSGGASALPELFKSLVTAQREGKGAEAMRAQAMVRGFKDIVRGSPIAAYYEILRARGVECGIPRAPLLPMDKKTAAQVISDLKALSLL